LDDPICILGIVVDVFDKVRFAAQLGLNELHRGFQARTVVRRFGWGRNWLLLLGLRHSSHKIEYCR
jgi:hypothetical protein